jgi:hypothetical protein
VTIFLKYNISPSSYRNYILRILPDIAIVIHPNMEVTYMFRKIFSAAAIIACSLGVSACASLLDLQETTPVGPVEPKKEVKTETAVTGGFLGAFRAESIGEYTYEKKSTKEETARKYHYKPSQGIQIKIENASVVPDRVKAGETVKIRMTYAVLGAASRKELTITETREIRYKGELFGKPKTYVTRGDGTYSSSVPVTLPSSAKKGRYKILLTVQTHKRSASKEATFYVN